MRKALATLALIALALPAVAQEDTQTVDISHELVTTEDGTRPAHKVEGRSGNTTDIRTSINGHFLWVTFGDSEDTYDADLSVDISDVTITQAIVSLDGTVTLIREAPAGKTATAPELAVETVDSTVEFSDTVVVQVFGIRAE